MCVGVGVCGERERDGRLLNLGSEEKKRERKGEKVRNFPCLFTGEAEVKEVEKVQGEATAQ